MIVCRRNEVNANNLIVIDANTADEAIAVLNQMGLNPNDYKQPFTKVPAVVSVGQYGAAVCWVDEAEPSPEYL
jgi:hypothetical protein